MARIVRKHIPARLSSTPAFTILGIVNIPEEYTIALGGVETGNIKAQLAASVTGIQIIKGGMPD